MNHPRILRLLRIAFTTVCGIICLLLIALWVRSTYSCDIFQLNVPFVSVVVNSAKSRIGTGIGLKKRHHNTTIWLGAVPHKQVGNLDEIASWRFRLEAVGDGFIVQAPHWFLIIFSMALASLSWTRWRFSLRTLVMATTLVAVALGLAVAVL